jgi:threonine/homoserine/homoserine lactone efflux protein
MPLATFLALLTFAFVTSITPGPNNMMLFASGVNYGFKRTIPHMIGISCGFFLLLLGVGFGLGEILESYPVVFTVLKFAGGAYLLYIAWTIATSRSITERTAGARPMTFLEAAAFQWVNPKAWVMALGAMTTYPDPQHYVSSVWMIAAVFALVNLPSVSSWAGFGSALREWLSVPPRLKWFNISMGGLLALSLWPMMK